MNRALKYKWIWWIPFLIGTGLAFTMISYGFFICSATDQPKWFYDLGDALMFLGLLWLARIAIGVRRLLGRLKNPQ